MIQQFDVCRNPSRVGRDDRPFIVVLQSRLLQHLRTRVCAPLVREGALVPDARLNPVLKVQGRRLMLSPTELVSLPVAILGPAVANLEPDRDKITTALDLVFLGI
jgi:toxin CcdB